MGVVDRFEGGLGARHLDIGHVRAGDSSLPTFTIGGTVAGPIGGAAVLQLNGNEILGAAVNISFAFTDALARGFDLFGTQFVKTGNFDRLLLRPRSTVLQLAGHEFTLFRVGRLLQGVIVLLWACHQLALDWTAARVALLAFTLIATFLFFYGLVIVGAVMSFWTTETLEIMNTLTYGGVETAQYPMAIYQKYFQRFFTFVVPLAMVTYFPIVAILGIPDPLGSTRTMQTLAPTAGFVFFGCTLLLWRVGVQHYTSTGS